MEISYSMLQEHQCASTTVVMHPRYWDLQGSSLVVVM